MRRRAIKQVSMNKKALFDDAIPWIGAGIFLFIAYLLLFFVNNSHRDNQKASFEYYHALLGSNTRLVSTLQDPIDKDCAWFKSEGRLENEVGAKRNLVYVYGKNPYFSNLDWLILFMKLQPKKEIQGLGNDLFVKQNALATTYLEGYLACASHEPPPLSDIVLLGNDGKKIRANIVNSFIGTNVLRAQDEIITFGITIPSPDIRQEPFAFNYQQSAEDESS